MGVVILPLLTSFLTNYQVSALLGGLGIEWVPQVSWTDYLLLWVSTPSFYFIKIVKGVVVIPLTIADKLVSTLIWWNTSLLVFMKSCFGIVGLWATVKVASIIKLIYAHTVGTMAAGGLTGVLPAILVFVSQTMIHGFIDPIHTLATNFSLSALALFLVPDPLGIWNLFISINLIPWTLIREVISDPNVLNFISFIPRGFIFCWNHLIQDFGLSWAQQLVITSTPVDIITYIFGPMDQRLGDIISSVSSLRSIWR
jgi:hypothetical protein